MTRTTSRRAGIGLVIALLLVVAACTSSDETTTPSATTVASIPSEAASPVPSKGAETTSATCEEITRFGETVVSTGITYDYTPSTSPAALAEQSEVVVVGTTTGDAELIPGESASDLVVAITVEVDEVLRSTLPNRSPRPSRSACP